mgnify:CR=1 FL=1
MEMLKIPEDEPIEAGMISKAIEEAQSKIEGFNLDARSHLLEYDNVINKHRETIYRKRKEALERTSDSDGQSQILELLKKYGIDSEAIVKAVTEPHDSEARGEMRTKFSASISK